MGATIGEVNGRQGLAGQLRIHHDPGRDWTAAVLSGVFLEHRAVVRILQQIEPDLVATFVGGRHFLRIARAFAVGRVGLGRACGCAVQSRRQIARFPIVSGQGVAVGLVTSYAIAELLELADLFFVI
ncbi:MAG: hypothetical protein MZW92_60940 [Comamonadaceae bacterium]|nr:hypothetical protein [Comamonadaceae bacterium]